MAMTLRVPEQLQQEAQARAERMGISVSALCLVALRHYLNDLARVDALVLHGRPVAQPAAAVGPLGSAAISTASQLSPAAGEWPLGAKPPKNPRAPCPCGSGNQWRHCHGKEVQGQA